MKIVSTRRFRALVCVPFLASVAALSSAATVEELTRQHVNNIRSIRADGDSAQTDKYNKQMDDAWTYFEQNRQVAIPILRNELMQEIAKKQRSDLVLLDVGSFLYKNGSPTDKPLATRSLYALDTNSKIIQWNEQELFLLTHLVAADHDAKVLDFIDKAFLHGKHSVFIVQHALTLDESLICAFLYGVYGPESESHLLTLLGDASVTIRVAEILSWIGTPASNSRMKSLLETSKDYETFARATRFMMTMAGPEGRSIMLAFDPKQLDQRSKEYFAKVKGAIEQVTYQGMYKQFEGMGDREKLSDEEMKKRLAEMLSNNGLDEKTSPLTVLDSKLSSQYLINELLNIRSRMFRRISDEALSDIQTTNALVNALRYK